MCSLTFLPERSCWSILFNTSAIWTLEESSESIGLRDDNRLRERNNSLLQFSRGMHYAENMLVCKHLALSYYFAAKRAVFSGYIIKNFFFFFCIHTH